MSNNVLNTPDWLPRWATGASTTVEPSETEKTSGHVVDTASPARKMNWWQNNVFEWVKRIAAGFIASLSLRTSALSANPLVSILFHPTLIVSGRWLAVNSTGVVYSSTDGRIWAGTGHTTAAAPQYRSRAVDSTYAMFGTLAGVIEYTSDGAATWATDSGLASGTVARLRTKYPTSDFLMAAHGANALGIAASGLGGGWTTPTTPPTTLTGTVSELLWLGGSSWLAFGGSSKCERSTDDGDTWAVTATTPYSETTMRQMNNGDVNRESGVVIVVGGDATGGPPIIVRSTDLGDSWAEALVVDVDTAQEFFCVKHIGGGIWYAGIDLAGTTYGTGAGFVSYDDGATWYPATYITGDTTAPADIQDVDTDGRRIIACRDDSRVINSLALPGSLNG